jgi:arsenate reductase
MAEAIMNHRGRPDFVSHSAGSQPSGKVRPEALRQLKAVGFSVEGLRSKSWDEFSREGAPTVDLVVTVCDNAAREVCPVWPGHPMTAHWGVADPAAVRDGEQAERAFRETLETLDRRIGLFLGLPFDELHGPALKDAIDEIGRK